MTNQQCNICHNTNNWTTLAFRHSSTAYPGDHRTSLSCNDCHKTNAEIVPWPNSAYQPDCAACHAGDYKPGKHKNAAVSTLRNCAGTCHKSSPEHRVSDRSWD
ncbi:MAG: hypothetical protein IT488_02635 [Gammaproteobacteria bacterium]|nr:hypothetical protein [Gammaproteobacteria bacterium]